MQDIQQGNQKLSEQILKEDTHQQLDSLALQCCNYNAAPHSPTPRAAHRDDRADESTFVQTLRQVAAPLLLF